MIKEPGRPFMNKVISCKVCRVAKPPGSDWRTAAITVAIQTSVHLKTNVTLEGELCGITHH